MKKGTVTRWKKPIAALLGMALVLGTVCGAGSMLPAGVKDALPEAVRETVMPLATQAAGGDPAMAEGAGVLQTGAGQDGAQRVWFGQDKSGNTRDWWVIAYDGKNGEGNAITYNPGTGDANLHTTGAVTLLHRNSSETMAFQYAGTNNKYGESDLINHIGGWLDLNSSPKFTEAEKNAILPRILTGGSSNYGVDGYDANHVSGTTVNNAYLWPLSVAEASKLPDSIRSTGSYWWLRSPGGNVSDAAYVFNYGGVREFGIIVNDFYGVRPAFDLNLQSVIFTSAAEGGKSSGSAGADALTAVSAMNVLHSTDTAKQSEWKLTLKDDGSTGSVGNGHEGFTANRADGPGSVVQGGQIKITYSGAKTTTNEYVSVYLKDNNTGTIMWYGHLAKQTASANNASLTIPADVRPGEYTVGVFAEQCNDDYKTDLASEVSTFTLTVTAQTHTVTVTGTGHGTVSPTSQSGAQNDTVTLTATPDTGYRFVRWEVTQAGGGSISNATANPATFTIGTADAAVQAVFEAITYTVAFNSNGGAGNMTSQSRIYDDGVALTPNAFTNGPFPFTGWNTAANGTGAAYGDKATDNLTDTDGATVILYAMWNMAQITTNTLPDGTEGAVYNAPLTTSGTTGTVTWALASGELPDGLSLDPSGTISGTPSKAGTYTFTLQATDSASPLNVLTKDYTIKISAKSSPAPTPTPSGSCATGHATYQWSTIYYADEHNDGEMVYCCSSCGHILYRVPISGYIIFNKNTMKKILDAPQGATINIRTARWISFHRMVYQALADRPDVTLTVSFLDGEYRGNRYSVTIPAGYDTLSLLNGTDYCGFLYLGSKFGLSPGE